MSGSLKECKIEGKDAEVDSFVACIAAALKYWGREYEYEYIAGLSGTPFSPTWYESEDCMAWWTEFGNHNRIKFLGKSLGFHVIESPKMSYEEYKRTGERSRELKEFWERAKEAVGEGKIVLVGTWPSWAIIRSWDEGTDDIKLASLEYLTGICKVESLTEAYILTPGPAEYTRADSIKEALRFGADIADGTFSPPGFKFGGKLYDAILKRMEHDLFCEPCGEDGWSCALRTMARVNGTNTDAVNFLEFAREFLGQQVPASELGEAVRGYKSIVEISGEYMNRDLLKENWNDADFRAGFVAKIQAMKDAHRDAAGVLRRLANSI